MNWNLRYSMEDSFVEDDPNWEFEKLIDQARSENPKNLQKKHLDWAKSYGITPKQIMDMHNGGHDLGSYVIARSIPGKVPAGRTHATHEEAMDALNNHLEPLHYACLRTGRALGSVETVNTPLSHEEAKKVCYKTDEQFRQLIRNI